MQSSSGVRILVVDDEEALLRLLLSYLTRLGYSVKGCGTAAAAVDLFTATNPEFSLVVMDLTLPDRQGDEVAVELMQLNPKLRVLLCSGYLVTPETFPAEMRSRVGVLQKPFLPKMLVREVERLLALDA